MKCDIINELKELQEELDHAILLIKEDNINTASTLLELNVINLTRIIEKLKNNIKCESS